MALYSGQGACLVPVRTIAEAADRMRANDSRDFLPEQVDIRNLNGDVNRTNVTRVRIAPPRMTGRMTMVRKGIAAANAKREVSRSTAVSLSLRMFFLLEAISSRAHTPKVINGSPTLHRVCPGTHRSSHVAIPAHVGVLPIQTSRG